jgi:hypothetical protein
MATIPSHRQWIADTSSLTSPRSALLKNLDERIAAFEMTPNSSNRENIKGALNRWIADQTQQKKDWKDSVRNKKGAVTNLFRALDVDNRNLTADDFKAMRYIARQQSKALKKQFAGRTLQFKSSTLLGMRNKASDNWTRFKTGASSAKDLASQVSDAQGSVKDMMGIPGQLATLHSGGASAVRAADVSAMRVQILDFVRSLCKDIDPHHVFNALSLGSPEVFVADMAPFMGAISSGGTAIVGWIGVAKLAFVDDAKMKRARCEIHGGDPMAAFEAVSRMLTREITAQATKAGVATAAFTGKALGTFADGGAVTGPLFGALEKLAAIFQTIFEYVRDYQEVRAANALLTRGALDLDLFEVCPTLGCYFLTIQDHSTIINFAVADYGTANWQFDVEQMIKRIDVVLSKSRQYIWASRFEVPGMQHAKGIQDSAFSHKHGLEKVTAAPGEAVDRVTSVPGAIKDKIMARIDAWRSNPVKLPELDKSRIYGQGWRS